MLLMLESLWLFFVFVHKENCVHIYNNRALATQPEDSVTRETWHYAWDVYIDSCNICALLQGIPSGCKRDRRGLNKQVTSSADNVTVLYSTVHVLSCVHPKCLLSDAANNTDRISELCWFIITVSKHQWTVCYQLWYSKLKHYFQCYLWQLDAQILTRAKIPV
jgi:hypothetical protein